MRVPSIITCLWASSVQGAALGTYMAPSYWQQQQLIICTGPFARRLDLSSAPVVRDMTVNTTSQQSQNIEAAAAFPVNHPDGYWLNDMSGNGIAAFNSNPSGYKVFRNVKDYGAVGT